MLLFMDSFDHYETADIVRKWTAMSNATIGASSGRRSTQGLVCNSASATVDLTVPAQTTYVVGAAIFRTTNTARGNAFTFKEGATTHVVIGLEPGGFVSAYRGAPTSNLLGISTLSRIRQDTWGYLEAKVLVSNTVGTVEIRYNGEVLLNLTNQDTGNAGTPTIDGIGLAGTINFDDLYICDITGSLNNDFLGDCEVEHVVPDGAGNVTQWANVTGAATHWQAVDESPAIDDLTTFIDTATNTDLDLFTFANLSTITGGSTILAVQANCQAQVDSGAATIRQVTRPTTVNFNGANFVLGTAWANIREIWEQDPQAVAAWTDTTFNASEFGVEKVA